MLLEIMDELDAEPGRTLMIGDTTHDLLMARNAGVATRWRSATARTRCRVLRPSGRWHCFDEFRRTGGMAGMSRRDLLPARTGRRRQKACASSPDRAGSAGAFVVRFAAACMATSIAARMCR
jgi:hypothetical protein